MTAPYRRSLITAAAAFAGGAVIASPAIAERLPAQLALAVVDPIPGLVAELNRLLSIESGSDDEEEALFEQIDAVENRIADTVAGSVTGLIMQVELFRSNLTPFQLDDRELRMCDSIISGIRNLTAGGAA